MTDTQAIAARLTAAVKQAKSLRSQCDPECWGRCKLCPDTALSDLIEASEALSAHVETLTQQVAELTWNFDKLKLRFEQRTGEMLVAEQQRDAAHAALRKYGRHTFECSTIGGYGYPCSCGLDAALAASAPQKRLVGCERADGTLNIHAESETCEICAPAQETERCR